MRIAILGAGAVGSWFGGYLSANGHEVFLLTTNQAHINAVTERGLQLRAQSGVTVVTPQISQPDEFSEPVELIIALTKTFQLRAALARLSDNVLADTSVLSFQNGLGNAEVIAEAVGIENTWIGVTMLPVDKIAPGVVECMGAGTTWFGHATGVHLPMARTIQALFADTALNVQYDQFIQKRVWEKVAFNAGMNAVCALANGTPGTIASYPPAKELVITAAKEVAEVAEALGVNIELHSVMNTIKFACEKHADHIPSMRQDLLDGKPTEVGAINGAIVEKAKKAGIPVPVNQMLATLILLAEQSMAKRSL